ncbi:MAG: hypothetical protein M1118_06765 [Chloroflexi bacterium]|nr:hypothetical protein [Chloroflexota bacterium]
MDEAWELVRWLQSDEWWTISIPITAQHPSRKSLQGQWVQMLKKDNPGFEDKHLEAFEAPMKRG